MWNFLPTFVTANCTLYTQTSCFSLNWLGISSSGNRKLTERERRPENTCSSWRNPNVPTQRELPAALEPLPLTISTLLELTPAPVPDSDIEITSEEEETFQPTKERFKRAMSNKPTEIKARLPDNFLGKNEDAMWWLLAMKAYFGMNQEIYKDEKNVVLVFLNKMSKGRGGTFAEGWYLKLIKPEILESEKTFKKLCDVFEETFIPKDMKDWACQMVYSLNMGQFNGDFDQYATAFRLAQAHCRVDLNSILVDTLQQGVTNQLAIMMTTAALPKGQEKTGCKWEQWLDKAGEFYWNVVWLKKLQSGGDSAIPAAQQTKTYQSTRDPYAMDMDKINLSPSGRVEHRRNHKCFICHKEGCHLNRHKGYPRRKERPKMPTNSSWRKVAKTKEVKEEPQIHAFMKKHRISMEHALDLLGNYYEGLAYKWDGQAKEELVNKISQGF